MSKPKPNSSDEELRQDKLASTAAKIITRNKLGYQVYTPEKLAWAYKVFTRRGGLARVKSMSAKERSELAKKAGKASVKAMRRRARLLTELETKIGSEKMQELLGN